MNSKIKYDKENLELFIKEAKTWREVCDFFKKSPTCRAQGYVKTLAKRWGLDYSHFLGKDGRNGRKGEIRKIRPVTDYLVENSTIGSASLRLRLIRSGVKDNKCEMCGITEWQGEPAPLELDHINSNHFDNRLENLQILCANCHGVKTKRSRFLRTKNPEKSPYRLQSLGFLPKKPRKEPERTVKSIEGHAKCRKVLNRPSKEELEIMIWVKPMTKIGKDYGVSDNAVKKWCKSYGIEVKGMRGYWARKNAERGRKITEEYACMVKE